MRQSANLFMLTVLPTMLVTTQLMSACVTSPKEHAELLSKMDSAKVLTLAQASAVEPTLVVKFQDRTKGWLEDKDQAFLVDEKTGERSFFKVYAFDAKASEQIIEVHTQAHKPIGYGRIGIIYPLVSFFDPSGKELKNTENIFFDYDRTFMDGEYLRSVYKLKNLTANKRYRILVGSKTSRTGTAMKSATNYAGAGVGLILHSGVEVSPVGPFWILQTDTFKK
jgi:hypothetical protein